jgi:hypothetical protein
MPIGMPYSWSSKQHTSFIPIYFSSLDNIASESSLCELAQVVRNLAIKKMITMTWFSGIEQQTPQVEMSFQFLPVRQTLTWGIILLNSIISWSYIHWINGTAQLIIFPANNALDLLTVYKKNR